MIGSGGASFGSLGNKILLVVIFTMEILTLKMFSLDSLAMLGNIALF